jgi:ubiquinone biosynthesis protein
MNSLQQFYRLSCIGYVLIKHGLDEIVLETPLFRSLRFLIFFSALRWKAKLKKPRGVRIREALEELGPIFVKFGQVLSTRMDILPEDIIQELVKLQDQVPSFSGDTAEKLAEKALGKPLTAVFNTFDKKPLASASIAQVHAATTLEGKEVVVKILRPNIDKVIQRDVALMQQLAKWTDRYWKKAKSFRPKDIVQEFKRSITEELDLMREAANASQLKRNFQQSNLLYIPEIYWPLSRKNLLVMERIYGIPISNLNALKEKGVDFKILSERIVNIFFTQVFRDCFFHADLHPGNLLVCTENPKMPSYIAVDFGIIGTLGPDDQRYLAENFLAFFKRDYRRVAELHIESGWVPHKTKVDEFESAVRTVCEPIFERPLKELSLGQTLLNLFQIAHRFKMNIQPQFMLLQKTLLNVEGLGRQLYPELDLWHTARPVLESWMKTQMGPKSFIRQLKLNGPYWLEKLPLVPELFYKALHQLSKEEPQPPIEMPKKQSVYSAFGLGVLVGVMMVLICVYIQHAGFIR